MEDQSTNNATRKTMPCRREGERQAGQLTPVTVATTYLTQHFSVSKWRPGWITPESDAGTCLCKSARSISGMRRAAEYVHVSPALARDPRGRKVMSLSGFIATLLRRIPGPSAGYRPIAGDTLYVSAVAMVRGCTHMTEPSSDQAHARRK